MSAFIDKIENAQKRKVPNFDPGDRVRVHFQVVEGTRRRTQVFEGFVIKRQGSGVRETFTVRKQSFGVGVERTFPVHSPKIEKIEIAARGEVRRAKLYYLRDRVGKAARVRERAWSPQDAQGSIDDAELVEAPEPVVEEVAPDAAEAQAAPDSTEADSAPEAVEADAAAEVVEAEDTPAEAEVVADDAPADEAPTDEAPAEAAAEAEPASDAPAEDAAAEEPAAESGEDKS